MFFGATATGQLFGDFHSFEFAEITYEPELVFLRKKQHVCAYGEVGRHLVFEMKRGAICKSRSHIGMSHSRQCRPRASKVCRACPSRSTAILRYPVLTLRKVCRRVGPDHFAAEAFPRHRTSSWLVSSNPFVGGNSARVEMERWGDTTSFARLVRVKQVACRKASL